MAIDTRVAGHLNRLFPSFEENVITASSSDGTSAIFLELPPAQGADYQFLLYFEPEMQIHARLLGRDQKQYFWYMPFEDAAYRHDPEKLRTAFVSTAEELILRPTRVVQKRGLLFDSFKLESQRDGRWVQVYKMACLRFAFKVPPIRGTHVYFSSPVVQSPRP